MNNRPLQFIWMSALACLFSSCMPDVKVDDYPLPHGGVSKTNPVDVQDPTTIGSDTAPVPNSDNIPELPPGNVEPMGTGPQGGGTSGTKAQPPADGQYPYAIPIPGDPTRVRNPYDTNQIIEIVQPDGKIIPSGKLIRAVGETDPNKKFRIP